MAGPAVAEGAGFEYGAAAVDQAAVEEDHVPFLRLDGDFGQAVFFE